MASGKKSPWLVVGLVIGVLFLGVCGFGGYTAYQAGQQFMSEKLPPAEEVAERAVRNYTENWEAIALFSELHPTVRRTTGKPDQARAQADKEALGKVTKVEKPVFTGVTSRMAASSDPHMVYTFSVKVTGEKATRTAKVEVREQEGRFGLESLTWE